jgi:hypothetical protein
MGQRKKIYLAIFILLIFLLLILTQCVLDKQKTTKEPEPDPKIELLGRTVAQSEFKPLRVIRSDLIAESQIPAWLEFYNHPEVQGYTLEYVNYEENKTGYRINFVIQKDHEETYQYYNSTLITNGWTVTKEANTYNTRAIGYCGKTTTCVTIQTIWT